MIRRAYYSILYGVGLFLGMLGLASLRINCGYERVGNTSGICTECGNRLTCPTCAHELMGSTLGICPVCHSRFNALGAV